jgi:hypothetical protein
MKIKEENPEEGNPEKIHDIEKRGGPRMQESYPKEEDVETRKSSKHSESRKDRTPRSRKNKPHQL